MSALRYRLRLVLLEEVGSARCARVVSGLFSMAQVRSVTANRFELYSDYALVQACLICMFHTKNL